MSNRTCKQCVYAAKVSDETGKRIVIRCTLDQGRLPREMASREGLIKYMARDFAKDCVCFEDKFDSSDS